MADRKPSATIIGVDHGGAMARVVQLSVERKMPVIARNALSNEATPTISSFPQEGMRLFGEAATGKDISRAAETVADLKRWMSLAPAEQRKVGAESFAAEQVLAYHLQQLLSYCAEAHDASVIAVAAPNNADPAFADVLRVAAGVAGFCPERVMAVPEAHAVMAYFHHLQFAALPGVQHGKSCDSSSAAPVAPQVAVVVNVGAQFTSITAFDAVKHEVRHRATRAIAVGSETVDEAVAGLVFDDILAKKKVDIRDHHKSFVKVRRDCKKAKEMLSSMDRTTIQIESLKDDIDVAMPFTRRELEAAAAPFLAQLKELIADIKAAAGLGETEIRVEAIGNAWRSPCIQQLIKDGFGVDRIGVSLDCNTAIAEGAAIAAAIAATEIGGESREPTHECTIEGVDPIAMEPLSEAAAKRVEQFRAAEVAMHEKDEAVKARLRAVDAAESFVFTMRRVVGECIKDGAASSAASAKLEEYTTWLYDDCDGKPTDAITAQLAVMEKEFREAFPQVTAYENEQRELQRRKDEELEQLSKLNEEDKELKTDPQRLRAAQQRREQGVTLFKQEHYQEAQTRFVQALGILGQLYAPLADDVKPKKDEISLSCHLNIASCSVKLGMWRNAVNNCTSALEIPAQENNAKALYRRGQALAALHDNDAAMKDLIRARDLSNGDAAIVAEIAALEQKMASQKAKEKKMFSKMFA